MQRLLAFLILIFASPANSAVWTATSTWTDAEERHYQEWISKSFTEDFFTRGQWAGIETDCADAVYAARIIFSFENGLPFSTRSSLKTTNGTIALNNEATTWDHLPSPEARVRAFIDSVNDVTWTGSLARDTDPVEITRETIRPGVLWLRPGHVELVKNVRMSGAVDLIGSTVPATVRQLMTVTDLGFIPDKPSLGFRKWRWPGVIQNSTSSGALVSIAPDSQKTDFLNMAQAIFRFEAGIRDTLGNRAEPETETIHRVAHDFCTLLQSRVEIVELSNVRRSKLQSC